MALDRTHAHARGLRAAAQVATVAGIVAGALAVAGVSRAQETSPSTESVRGSAAPGKDDSASRDVSNLFAVRGLSAGCGCSPCWGPPAPPDLDDDDLTALMAEVPS
jgi:hypothetical protein